MATFYVNSAAPGGGDGTIGLPYNAIPGNALGTANEWVLTPGSIFDLGAAQLTSGNSALVRRGEGEGLNPEFRSTNATLFTCSTATGLVHFNGVNIVRSGAQGGTGVNCTQMTAVGAEFRFESGIIAGFNTNISANRTRKLTTFQADLMGSVTTYGIRAIAQNANNCENWSLTHTTFDCGIDLDLLVGDSAGTTGSFVNLLIEDCRMVFNGAGYGGTSMQLRGNGIVANDYTARAYITGAGSGGGVLQRDDGSGNLPNTGVASPVWPSAWTPGTVLFLAGWEERANFGTITVTGGAGTRSVTYTNLGATTVNETIGIGKGCAVFDPLRAFVNPVIRRNTIGRRGYTPTFFDLFVGGLVESNTVHDTVAVASSVAAAFEHFGCQRTISRYNQVLRMTGSVLVDSMGLFWDGACVDCIGLGNYFEGIRPTTAATNAGAGMASFFSLNCYHLDSIVENCTLGFWAGGVATRGTVGNCDLGGCDIGVSINSSPAAGAITVRSNDIQRNGQGIRDSSSAYVLGNSWSQNVIDNAFGTLASKDPGAVPAGQEFRLLPTPIRQVGAHPRAALEYVD